MLTKAAYEVHQVPGGPDGGEYRVVAPKFVETGRRRELSRAVVVMVVLFCAQFPLRQTARGSWTSVADLDSAVHGRLSLILDLAFIVAELTVAYRAWGLVRSRRPDRKWICASKIGLWLVLLGAALDVWEDVRLWMLLDDMTSTDYVSLKLTFGQAALIHGAEVQGTPLYSYLMSAVSAVGLAIVLLLALFVRGAERPPLAAMEAAQRDDVIICCSGGGIRASAFSLGGLQVLQEKGIYAKASAVVGVSGGGYIAAAHHVVRWKTGDGQEARDWSLKPTNMPAFALGSPETQWLRRHTRYIVGSVGDLTYAALSLAFGIAVNLLLLTLIIGGTAWMLAWLFLASGRLHPWDVNNLSAGMSGRWAEDWTWLSYVWILPAAGIVLFLAEKFIDQFRTLSVGGRSILRTSFLRIPSRWLIWIGGALTVLVLGVPWVVETLSRYAATSGSTYARLLHQIGFVPNNVCTAIVATGRDGCGVDQVSALSTQSTLTAVGSVSVAAVVSSILAVLASAKSASTSKESSAGPMASILGRVWAKVKDPLVPYAAVAVIALVAATVLLRWVTRLVEVQGLVAQWWTAFVVGGLLVVAKVFTDANRTSMHHFFRERISEAFLVQRTTNSVDAVDYRWPLRFSEAAPPSNNGPRLVACAVANVSDEELVPSKRGCTPFVFDDQRMGLTDRLLPEGAARRASALYEFAADDDYRDATIPAAIAISAAAFSPLAGRENVRVGPYRAVLALGNARLGVWLPNPIWVDELRLLRRLLFLGRFAEAAAIWAELSEDDQRYLDFEPEKKSMLNRLANHRSGDPPVDTPDVSVLWLRKLWAAGRNIFKKPGMNRLIKEAVGKASVYDRFLYVTDGGHYDNLGLIEALRRKPKEIYVLDASNDAEDTFSTLGRAIATARMDLDCDLVMDPRGMRRLAQTRSASAWCVGDYTFSSTGETGRVYLAKAIMLDALPWDIETYSSDNKEFPRTSTAKQLYSEFDFEAYRELGSSTVCRLLQSVEYLGPVKETIEAGPGADTITREEAGQA